jgi:hypothetical protein
MSTSVIAYRSKVACSPARIVPDVCQHRFAMFAATPSVRVWAKLMFGCEMLTTVPSVSSFRYVPDTLSWIFGLSRLLVPITHSPVRRPRGRQP